MAWVRGCQGLLGALATLQMGKSEPCSPSGPPTPPLYASFRSKPSPLMMSPTVLGAPPCEPELLEQAESNRVLAEIKTLSVRSRRLLRAMPFCMSLTQRMRVFEHLVKADKARHQPENTPGVPIRVRRCGALWRVKKGGYRQCGVLQYHSMIPLLFF